MGNMGIEANLLGKRTHYYLPVAQLPEELIYLLISLQDSSYRSSVEGKIPRLDYLLEKITPLDLLQIVKIETSKFLLEEGKERTKSISLSSGPDQKINLVEEFITEHQSELKIFTTWFLQAYLQDLRRISNSEHYPPYLEQQQLAEKQVALSVQSLRKKINLLTPWSHLVLTPSFTDFYLTMDEISHGLFQHLLATLEQFAQQTIYNFDNQTPKELSSNYQLKYFSLVPVKKDFAKVKSLNEILAPAINPPAIPAAPLAERSPKLPVWMPKEDRAEDKEDKGLKIGKGDQDDKRKQNALIFPTPDPIYQAPKVLPTPINDWQVAEEINLSPDNQATNKKPDITQQDHKNDLFPTPNPAYIPPRELPRPVENW